MKRFRRRRFTRTSQLARKRRTWFTAYNVNWCNVVEYPIRDCNPEDVSLDGTNLQWLLLPNSSLQQEFSDRARVKRVLGKLWFQHTFTNPPPIPEFYTAQLYVNTYQSFFGLRKEQVNDQQLFLPVYPLSSDHDFGESQWLKTWQKIHEPASDFRQTTFDDFTMSFPVRDCDVVKTTGLTDNSFVSGTGTINIDTDCGDINCFECPQTGMGNVNTNRVGDTFHPVEYTLNWRSLKGIALRENEQLVMNAQFIHPYVSTYQSNNPVGHWFGNFKVLVEY